MIDLKGKRGLVLGVANAHSIAYGCARAFHDAGAALAITCLNDKAALESKENDLESHPFEELQLGRTAALVHQLSEPDIEAFAAISGDLNPLRVDKPFASEHIFHRLIAHGMWAGALISNVLGTQLPGPDTLYVHPDLGFKRAIARGTPSA